jgi:hypothetical protein
VADRFWVGGSGNWSSTGHWSTTTGGASGASVPTNADNAIFDANSGSPGAYTVTVDVAASCLDLRFSAAPSGGGTVTWAGALAMSVAGNLTLLAGMTKTYSATVTLSATSAGKTVTTNAVSMNGALDFNGVGGVWTLQDNFIDGAAPTSGSRFEVIAGTVNTNGFTVTVGTFNLSGGTLNAGASILNAQFIAAGATWNMLGTAFNCGTSTVNVTGGRSDFVGGGQTYNIVNFSTNGVTSPVSFTGNNAFATLSITGTASATCAIQFSGNNTVTGTFKYLGNSAVNRLFLLSNTLGTARTITAAAVDGASDFVDFRDIIAAGAAVPFAGANTRVGNCLGNTNITFTPAVNRFWRGGTGNWSDTAHWATISGGVGGASVPIPQDTAFFDANSFSGGSITASFDRVRLGSIDASTVTLNPIFNRTAGSIEFYGTTYSWAVGTTINSINPQFLSRSATNLTFNGGNHAGLTFSGPGGSYTLQSAVSMPDSGGINVGNGATLNLNGKTVTIGAGAGLASFTISAGATLNMAASLVIINADSSNNWNADAACTINAGTSTIKFTSPRGITAAFSGAGKTYNILWFSRGGVCNSSISGANTIASLLVDQDNIVEVLTANNVITALTLGKGAAFRYSANVTVNGITSQGGAALVGEGKYASFHATAGSNMTTPDSAALTITGDIDIQADLTLISWTPQGVGVGGMVVTKASSGVQIDYNFYVGSDGKLSVGYPPMVATAASSVATGFASGSRHWVRFQRISATGICRFYTSNDGIIWTQLGADVAGTAGAATHGAGALSIGEQAFNGTAQLVGRVHRVKVYNGLDGAGGVLKLDFNPTLDYITGATCTSSVTGEVLTLGAAGVIGAHNLISIFSPTTSTLTKSGGGTIVVPYVNVRKSTAAPASTFFTDANNLNEAGNTNWTFGTAASRVGSSAGVATVSGVANKIVGRTASAAGAATVSGIGNKIVGRGGAAVGLSAVIGDSRMVKARVGTADGFSTCIGEHRLPATMTTPVERFIKPEPQDRSYRV